MRHIDDGQLHAILDEALHAFDPDVARWIQTHLEDCEECRGRLDAERGVHARAAALLNADDPIADVPLPTLEEMQREAGARTGGGRRTRQLPLGWAAMVAVALGVGYGLGVMDGPGPRAPSEPADAPTLLEESATEDAAAAPAVEEVAGAAVPAVEEVAAEAEVPVAGLARAPEKSVADPPPADRAVVNALPPAVRAREEFARGAASDAPAPEQAGSVVRVTAETDQAEAKRTDADASGALVLPGATVLEIVRGGVWPDQYGVLVRQRLADGTVVELRITGEPDAPALAAETLPEGWSRVVREDGAGWLVLAGPLPEARLRELLNALR